MIIFTEDSSRLGTYKGSGRSIEQINLYEVLNACTSSIIQFGGHAMAAGLAIHKDNLSFFTKQFQSVLQELDIDTDIKPVINVDYCPDPEEVFEKSFLAKYQHMQPFGNENSEPIFLFKEPKLVDVNVVKDTHLTFSLKCQDKIFRGIGFGMAEKIQDVRKNPVYMACKLKDTFFKGEKRVEIHAVDIIPTP